MFIPLVPGSLAKLGGGHAVALVSAINGGRHVVDVSPLSTLGTLCSANAAAHEDKHRLFQHLPLYGLAMAVFGALLCYVFFGLLFSSMHSLLGNKRRKQPRAPTKFTCK